MRKITITENDAGQRLDKFMHKFFRSAMPSSMIYKNIRKKRVKLNGKRAAEFSMLAVGDVLEMYINDEFFEKDAKPTKVKIAADFGIVYEDENIILIDKKAGTVVHSDDGGTVNTLVNQLCSYLAEKGEYDAEKENSFVPALCNRLDRNTSGIVIAAKNAASLREMNEIIKARRVHKYYLARAVGFVKKDSDTLTGYLFKDSRLNRVYVTDRPQKGAFKIVTKYKVIGRDEQTSLLEVELVTGKTHQIRAHLAHIGHPLLGDGKYGKVKETQRKTQALHAYKLVFDQDLGVSKLAYLSGRVFTSDSADFC